MARKRVVDAHASTDEKFRHWKTRFKSAALVYEQGDFKEARTLMFRAKMEAESLNPSDRDFALPTCHLGIAILSMAQGDLNEANEYFDKGLNRAATGADDSATELYAVGLRFRAHWHMLQDDNAEAEKCLRESVKILEELGEDSAVQLAYSLCDLCCVLLRTDQIDEATSLIKPAMEILLASVGPEDAAMDWAKMIYQTCLSKGNEELLAEVFDRSAMQYQYKVGARHPNLVRALNTYATTLKKRGLIEKLEGIKEKFASLVGQ